MPKAKRTSTRDLESGLERLLDVVEGRQPQASIFALLDMALCEVRKGYARVAGTPSADHLNFEGIVHGGYATTLLDSALGCAVFTLAEPGFDCATVALEVKLVTPVPVGITLEAEAHVVHAGRRQATAEGRVATSGGLVVAHGTTTCLVGLASYA